MSELSPTAQAVLDAFLGDSENTGLQMDDLRENVAAALRAAADQAIPPEQRTPWGSVIQAHEAELRIRNELLAIATELEAQ